MKKLLIIGMSMNVGGAEKSLVNLLNMIDHTQYSVDLLLFQQQGLFLKQIPEDVNIVEDESIKVLFQSAFDTLIMKKKRLNDFYLLFIKYFASIIEKIQWRQFDQIRLHRWIDYYSKLIPQNTLEYDVAVAYAGGETAYYMVDKVSARRKVYFFHSDYSKIDIDTDLERKYVDQVDQIVTISDVCKQSLDNLFPEKKDDITVLNNLSSSKMILNLAKEYVPKEFAANENMIKLVSVGRLNHIKGFDMAVDAANILKQCRALFRWVIVGEGEERTNLERQIKKYGLENEFFLVGLKENPYPYILNADLILQTSRFEGKSVVLDEAKILKKPAIITNYNSAHDQIADGVDGLIVNMNAEEIAANIMKCAEDRELLSQMVSNIKIKDEMQDVDAYMLQLLGDYKQCEE